jgi:photosystem II stability/assembly factor-like uncharacterized protein
MRSFAGLVLGIACVPVASADDSTHVLTRCTPDGSAVVDVVPHTGPGLDRLETADRRDGAQQVAAGGAAWQSMSVPPSIFLRAISMASPQVGFAAGELGKVIRTTDGGDSWHYVLDQGFPYYYYGCQTLDEQTVVVAGFQNQTGEGIIRWSDDGGDTWGSVIALPGPAGIDWLAHVEFTDPDHGIVEAAWSGGVHRTTTGGGSAGDWTYVEPSGSWFLGTFTYLADQRVWLAGIDVVFSPDGGVNWSTLPSTSAIFDGPIAILESDKGFIGGGTISPSVTGWVYGTDDAGNTWTDGPLVTPPYPVRGLMLLDEERAWAVGGNTFTAVGGIWGTSDGGDTWILEQDVGNELIDLDQVRVDDEFVDVYAAGHGSHIWRARVSHPIGTPCPWDLNDDGVVSTSDLLDLLSVWGTDPGGPPDFDGDNNVGTSDLLKLLGNWGTCP